MREKVLLSQLGGEDGINGLGFGEIGVDRGGITVQLALGNKLSKSCSRERLINYPNME